jgi:hypothetical protein
MFDVLKDIATALILAGVCAIAAVILKAQKQQILATVTDLIQKAETTITGSGMGAEKKAKVVTQLEAMGVKVNAWLSNEIDAIVKYLNEKSGWFADEAADTAKDAVEDAINSVT